MASRIAVVCVELIASPTALGVTRLEPLYAKAQTRLYSVQSYKGGVRDGRKLQRQIKNIAQIGA